MVGVYVSVVEFLVDGDRVVLVCQLLFCMCFEFDVVYEVEVCVFDVYDQLFVSDCCIFEFGLVFFFVLIMNEDVDGWLFVWVVLFEGVIFGLFSCFYNCICVSLFGVQEIDVF